MSRFRSAVTGRWVAKLFARQHPDTTVGERTPQKKRPADPVPCPYCGHLLDSDATFCPYCGTDLLED